MEEMATDDGIAPGKRTFFLFQKRADPESTLPKQAANLIEGLGLAAGLHWYILMKIKFC